MFLTSLYKNRKNEKLWKFPLFEGFSPQLIYILKCLISQWIVFIVYYQISIIILVYHSWLTRKRPISNETPSLEYRRVHLNAIVYKYREYSDYTMKEYDKKGNLVYEGEYKRITRKLAYQIRFCIFIDTKNFEMKFFI